jgi:hypothetical protein
MNLNIEDVLTASALLLNCVALMFTCLGQLSVIYGVRSIMKHQASGTSAIDDFLKWIDDIDVDFDIMELFQRFGPAVGVALRAVSDGRFTPIEMYRVGRAFYDAARASRRKPAQLADSQDLDLQATRAAMARAAAQEQQATIPPAPPSGQWRSS